MPFGKIIELPSVYSAYGRVKDEYGGEHTVHASEIPPHSEEGEDLAYHVDIWQNKSGNVTTLREGTFGPEDKDD